ncbi:MAG: zinc-ribbon domain-containing protein [Candidatus Hodarchaeota archaeon]
MHEQDTEYCVSCEEQIPDDATFCVECGVSQETDQELY